MKLIIRMFETVLHLLNTKRKSITVLNIRRIQFKQRYYTFTGNKT